MASCLTDWVDAVQLQNPVNGQKTVTRCLRSWKRPLWGAPVSVAATARGTAKHEGDAQYCVLSKRSPQRHELTLRCDPNHSGRQLRNPESRLECRGPSSSCRPCEGQFMSAHARASSCRPCEGQFMSPMRGPVHVAHARASSCRPCEGQFMSPMRGPVHVAHARASSCRPCEGRSLVASENGLNPVFVPLLLTPHRSHAIKRNWR